MESFDFCESHKLEGNFIDLDSKFWPLFKWRTSGLYTVTSAHNVRAATEAAWLELPIHTWQNDQQEFSNICLMSG